VSQQAIESALQLMKLHISALNQRNNEAVAATLHFPHHRLSGTSWKTWDTPELYLNDFLKRAGGDWNHSAFEDVKVVDSSDTKVHLDARIDRYDNKNNLMTSFRSLWVIIEIDGVWAAKVRSSFAAE